MAHFAKLNENNMVTDVIVVDNDKLIVNGIESEQSGKDYIASIGLEGTWIQTSYNNQFRKMFAGFGSFYDEEKDEFILLQEKTKWLSLANESQVNDTSKTSILVDGFPRSGNVYLSYLLGFGFKECDQYTGYNFFHNKKSITEAVNKFDIVVVPVRTPVDSIKSTIIYSNLDQSDIQSIFRVATDNLAWMKLIRDNKNNICVVDFPTLTSDPFTIINKIAKKIMVFPSEFTNQEVIDRMNEDNMSYNLPNDVTSNGDIDLSNPLIAEVIEEATAIYNEIIG